MADGESFVFDACALIAFFEAEPGADVVESLLLDTDHRRLIHAINVCEIYYDLLRRGSAEDASALETVLKAQGLVVVDEMPADLWRTAGDLKARWRRISLADCFALALTIREGATLVTTDHHELDKISEANVCPIRFIR